MERASGIGGQAPFMSPGRALPGLLLTSLRLSPDARGTTTVVRTWHATVVLDQDGGAYCVVK